MIPAATPLSFWTLDLSPHYGLISVEGPQAFTFLQGQLTCDLKALHAHHTLFGAICSPKGRVQAILRIFLKEAVYYLQLPRALLPSTLKELKKYGQFSKIQIQEANLADSQIGLYSDSPLFDTLLQTHPSYALNAEEEINQIDRAGVTFLKLPCAKGTRLELIGPPSQIEAWLQKAGEENVLADFEAWKKLDIEAYIPEIWPSTVDTFLPHSLNLPALQAVSFQKGCYRGQEIIARMEYRGNLKRHLVKGYSISTVPLLPGSTLYQTEGKETVGKVVSSSQNSEGRSELLVETSLSVEEIQKSSLGFFLNERWISFKHDF